MQLLKVLNSQKYSAVGGNKIGLENDVTKILLDLLKHNLTPTEVDSLEANGMINPSALQAAVAKLFSRLDLDGDGELSWWEWKQLLGISLRGRNVDSNLFIDPLDPLVMALEAANAALASLKPIDKEKKSIPPTFAALPHFNHTQQGVNEGYVGWDNESVCDSIDVFDAVKLHLSRWVSSAKMHRLYSLNGLGLWLIELL